MVSRIVATSGVLVHAQGRPSSATQWRIQSQPLGQSGYRGAMQKACRWIRACCNLVRSSLKHPELMTSTVSEDNCQNFLDEPAALERTLPTMETFPSAVSDLLSDKSEQSLVSLPITEIDTHTGTNSSTGFCEESSLQEHLSFSQEAHMAVQNDLSPAVVSYDMQSSDVETDPTADEGTDPSADVGTDPSAGAGVLEVGGLDDDDDDDDDALHESPLYGPDPKQKTKQQLKLENKERRSHGEEYTNSKGILVPKKKPKIVECKCQFQSCRTLTEEEMQSIHRSYWTLGNYSRQRDFLNKCIESVPVKRRSTGAAKPRTNSYEYNFVVSFSLRTSPWIQKLPMTSKLFIMDRPNRLQKKTKAYMDTISLINEVRKYPAIWDLNCPDYRDRELKRVQWNKVAAAFIGRSPNDAKKSWDSRRRSLCNHRNKFAKKYGASGSGAKEYIPYKYEAELSFLEGIDEEDVMVGSMGVMNDVEKPDANEEVLNDIEFDVSKYDVSKYDDDDGGGGGGGDDKLIKNVKGYEWSMDQADIDSDLSQKEPVGVKLQYSSDETFWSGYNSPSGKGEVDMEMSTPAVNVLKPFGLGGQIPTETPAARKERLKKERQKKLDKEREEVAQRLAAQVQQAKTQKEMKSSSPQKEAVRSCSGPTSEYEKPVLEKLKKEEDGPSLFLLSLAPSVRCLPPKDCRDFQIKVLQILQEIESRNELKPVNFESQFKQTPQKMISRDVKNELSSWQMAVEKVKKHPPDGQAISVAGLKAAPQCRHQDITTSQTSQKSQTSTRSGAILGQFLR
ncbi:Ubiquinone/menaquinone biosynthesis C-methyltransferase UbiE [Frankliniella fusca]|uniref:Ubiquinone/menaquinone biosynthesis C-methyltransferase UbiE n=1 Tax=Frankliniella fusca TaxID=407009 RepID=A0AAE1LJ78_9NEOP|nr:Ubiquinone/menaquinone biosynthesis C-methyltransferase UbiE [Frankliniella fusca]